MEINIGLIDYGMGNLHSVEQFFKRRNQTLKRVKGPEDLNHCNALILPGVGSFDPAMINLKQTNLIPSLKEWALDQKPLLGICLGLQLMFESSEEGDERGLGLIKGEVKSLPITKENHIPHMGWAPLRQQKECPMLDTENMNQWMYFVHSYSAIPNEVNDIAATVDFGEENITAVIWKDNLAACQFHPEKSGKSGEILLSKWVEWLKKSQLD